MKITGGRNRLIARTAGALGVVIVILWLILSSGDTPSESRVADERQLQPTDTTVVLDSASQRLAGIEIHLVAPSATQELVANGTITYDANRVAVVASRAEARVVSVRADLGQEVGPGGVLAVLESSEVGQTRGDLERARANLETSKRNYEREQRLFKEQITPQKEMLEAETAYRTAQADYRSAVARLRAIGASGGQGAAFTLSSPVGGTVVERNASPGQSVGPYTTLFTVADLRNVWITVDVYERDLFRIQRGSPATVVPNALPNEMIVGKVTYAGGVVDTSSHTFKVRVEVSNATLRLRPGMFAQVRIRTPAITAAPGSLAIPEVAVQDLNGEKVVFVASGQPGRFTVRRVKLGPAAGGGLVTVTNGLSGGERIVAKGAFQLKAELTKASLEESE
ncbi:MAG: efflux RND transporter periplasmic adaptor subunit [Gemmatimonadaceae bacterium]